MNRKISYLVIFLLLGLSLTACGKKEVVEEPPYSVNGLSIVPSPIDVTSETLPNIVSEEIIEESTIIESVIDTKIEESIAEETIIVETSNLNIEDTLIGSYWTCDMLDLVYYFEDGALSMVSNGIFFKEDYVLEDNSLTIDGETTKITLDGDSLLLTADGFGFVFEKGTKEDWDEAIGMPFDYESEFVGMTLSEFIETGVEVDDGYTGVGDAYLLEARNPQTEEAYEFIMSGPEVEAKLDEKELSDSVIDCLAEFPINAIRIYTKEEYLNCKLDLSIYKEKTVNDLYLDGFTDFQVELVEGEENRYIFKAWDYNFNYYSRPVIITLEENAQPIMDKYSGFLEQSELFENLKDFTILDIVYEEDLENIVE